jgi:hypothetical protein
MHPSPTLVALTRREFAAHLRSLGMSWKGSDKVAAMIGIEFQRALLPWWRRARLAWRSRHV